MLVMVPIISWPMFRPASAQRFIEMCGVRCKISCMPLAIVIATSIIAPNEPINTEARKISFGGNDKNSSFHI